MDPEGRPIEIYDAAYVLMEFQVHIYEYSLQCTRHWFDYINMIG